MITVKRLFYLFLFLFYSEKFRKKIIHLTTAWANYKMYDVCTSWLTINSNLNSNLKREKDEMLEKKKEKKIKPSYMITHYCQVTAASDMGMNKHSQLWS